MMLVLRFKRPSKHSGLAKQIWYHSAVDLLPEAAMQSTRTALTINRLQMHGKWYADNLFAQYNLRMAPLAPMVRQEVSIYNDN